MSQFFDSNPMERSAQGAARGGWSRDLPRTWRTALGLPAVDPQDAGAGDGPSGDEADAPPHLGVGAGEEPRI